jgi:hypothetical protein
MKLILTLFLSLSFFFSFPYSFTHAMRQMSASSVSEALTLMEGNWYDHAGNLVLQIHDGYINGCQVLAGYDFAGGTSHAQGQFRILESTGTRTLFLAWDISPNAPERDSIKLNDSLMLHRVAIVSYYESIAGVHLGMTPSEVQATLGRPTRTGNLRPISHLPGWYYADQEMIITFDADSVDRILLLKGSTNTLATSGLNCDNSPAEFARAYHLGRVPIVDYPNDYSTGGIYSIGHGENLSFGNHMSYVMLTKYSN